MKTAGFGALVALTLWPGFVAAGDDALATRLRTEGRRGWAAIEEAVSNANWSGKVAQVLDIPGQGKKPEHYDSTSVVVKHKPGNLLFEYTRAVPPRAGQVAKGALVFNPLYSFKVTQPKPSQTKWAVGDLAKSPEAVARLRQHTVLELGWMAYPHRFNSTVRMDEWFDQSYVSLKSVEAAREGERDLVRAIFVFTLPDVQGQALGSIDGVADFDPSRSWALVRSEFRRDGYTCTQTIDYTPGSPAPTAWKKVAQRHNYLGGAVGTSTFNITSFSTEPSSDVAFTLPAFGLPEVGIPAGASPGKPFARPDESGGQTPDDARKSRWPILAVLAVAVAACVGVATYLRKRKAPDKLA